MQFTMQPNEEWILNNDIYSKSGTVPEGTYRGEGYTFFTEDKSGEETSSGLNTRDVQVRPYA